VTAPDDPTAPPPRRAPQRPPIRLASADPRPEILLTAEVHKTTRAMVTALAGDSDLYQRSGQLVHVVRADSDDEGGGFAPGTPTIRGVPLSLLVNRVSEFARCLGKSRNGEWKHVSPPQPQVRAVLEQGSWRGLRALAGVVEAPSMRRDGSLIQDPGYDRATRTLYDPNGTFPRVSDSPTHSDAVRAYAHLADVFVDFPYVDPSHCSATVAALLTILVRPAIAGAVPCWLFDAASKRSGKSLQVAVVTLIATGRPAPVMTYPENDEELEKVLAGFALAGARCVNFDNVARPFGGAALDKCVTAIDQVQLRVLGRNDMPIVPWRAVILASGNQVTARGDMLPRLLSPRIESPLEQPETRSEYRYPDRAGEDRLCAWAAAHRPELVADALTLVRAYCAAGRPEVSGLTRWGGFSAWTSLVAAALVWAGAPSPLGARRGLEGDDDPRAAAELALVSGWQFLCSSLGQPSMTASDAIAHLYPPPRKDEPPDGLDDLRECIQALTSARPGFPPPTDRLSRALRQLKNRPIAGLKLSVEGKSKGIARWQVWPTRRQP